MSLPASPNTTYVATTTPSIKAADLNDLQKYGGWAAYMQSFGSGADGAVVFDGTTAALANVWTKSGNVYTAVRDLFFTDCTVTGSGRQLKMNGFRLFVNGTLTTVGGGFASADGNAAVNMTAGAASPTGSLSGGAAGGAGNNLGGAGTVGGTVTNSFGGHGGQGGDGSGGGAGLGMAGGNNTFPAASAGRPDAYAAPTIGNIIGIGGSISVIGGAGGGGAGADAVGPTGGGGGGGGGVLAIAARVMSLAAAGDLHATGGAGANGTGGGGGGGGGGGCCIFVYGSSNQTFSAATNCPGGAGGTSAGNAGIVGANGFLFNIHLGA